MDPDGQDRLVPPNTNDVHMHAGVLIHFVECKCHMSILTLDFRGSEDPERTTKLHLQSQ